LRLARHARRKGGEFPLFSDDDVVQHSVEEALAVRLERFEAIQEEEAARAAAVAAAEKRVQDALAQRRKAEL
jgi:hypothetical protein